MGAGNIGGNVRGQDHFAVVGDRLPAWNVVKACGYCFRSACNKNNVDVDRDFSAQRWFYAVDAVATLANLPVALGRGTGCSAGVRPVLDCDSN